MSVAGLSVNEQLVRDGAAEWYEQFASEDGNLAARLRVAEREAQSAGRGLWSACAGPLASLPRAPGMATPDAPGCHPSYPDECIPPPPPDLDCAEVKRRVRVDHGAGDAHGLDANRDGWGCESYR